MKKYPFYTALSQAFELYGVELDEDTFETYAMSAWKKIGNKDYKMYLIHATPLQDPDGGWYIQLPCNADSIEAVTLPYEDAQETHVNYNHYGLYTHPIEDDIEKHKKMPNELYLPGKYVKYKELGDRLYFTEPYRMVNILYKGLYADEDGLPYLNNKEVEAIAAYCAYVTDFKKGRQTKDQASMQIAQIEEARWKRLCDAARVSESISQNDMNEILSVMTSFNRSGYGRSYKPIN